MAGRPAGGDQTLWGQPGSQAPWPALGFHCLGSASISAPRGLPANGLLVASHTGRWGSCSSSTSLQREAEPTRGAQDLSGRPVAGRRRDRGPDLCAGLWGSRWGLSGDDQRELPLLRLPFLGVPRRGVRHG